MIERYGTQFKSQIFWFPGLFSKKTKIILLTNSQIEEPFLDKSKDKLQLE